MTNLNFPRVPHGMRIFVPHTSPVHPQKHFDFKMDTENTSSLRYTKTSPVVVEVGAVPFPDTFDSEHTSRKQFAKQHLVCHRRHQLTISLILTSIAICMGLLRMLKLLETLQVIRNTLKFELPSLTRMIQLCPACADSSDNADYRTLYVCGPWLQPSIVITSIVAQLVSFPVGKAWGRYMPDWKFNLFGLSIHLNPSPFNIKEHTLITVYHPRISD